MSGFVVTNVLTQDSLYYFFRDTYCALRPRAAQAAQFKEFRGQYMCQQGSEHLDRLVAVFS